MNDLDSKRNIETFAADNVTLPERKDFVDSLDRYSIRDNYGLELYKREYQRREERLSE